LDKEYRISEKDEIKKYLEIRKTAQQYFEDQKSGKIQEIDEQSNIEDLK